MTQWLRRTFPAGVVPVLLGILAWLLVCGSADALEKPHIVLILADDLGWNNVGYHGGRVKTPHLDRLAREGVRLEQFYVQPVCSPTRSSLMTGRFPFRQGLQVGVILPWAQYGLPLEERTLPAALKQAGYTTAICGKWHLGLHDPAYLPTRRGFDHQYGHYCGMLDYFTHKRDSGHDWHRNDQALYEEGYTTELIAKEAAGLIEKHDPAKRLFLYVPFNAPHTPLQVPRSYLRPYADITNKRHRIYAAMVTAMDDAIGTIVDALDRWGLRKDTLIFFCSDNGGPRTTGDNQPLRGFKGTLYEGGIRVPALAVWPEVIPAGSVSREPLHIVDLYPTLLKLAGASLEQPFALDGRDAWATIARGAPTPHEEIPHQIEPKRGAIRRGAWKLIVRGDVQAKVKATELYNLEEDPNEKSNVAKRHPDKVKDLLRRLKHYALQAVPPKPRADRKGFKVPKVWGEPN